MTDFVDVVLVDAGDDHTAVIRALGNATCEAVGVRMVDLAAARRLTETTPSVAVPSVRADLGAGLKEALEAAGATVELKRA
jgi:ribosomal protein L7/L12